jgi:hypothetical protein
MPHSAAIILRKHWNFPENLISEELHSFDKIVIDTGEEAMWENFVGLMPLTRSGSFIPGVDRQTAPHVTTDRQRAFRRLPDQYMAVVS